MKPILLLDIDGVLNVYDDVPMGLRMEREFYVDLFYIRIPVGTAKRLARLAEEFDIVWCTAWEDKARVLAPFVGLPEDLPFVRFTRASLLDETWKIRDVRAWADQNAQGRGVAWVDDDLHGDAQAWAVTRGDTIGVRTKNGTGLTEDVVACLMAFALGRKRDEAAA